MNTAQGVHHVVEEVLRLLEYSPTIKPLCCSAVEKKILHTLETQSAAQAQAAARAKAAINKAAQTDSVPLTSAQSKAR